MRLLILLVSSLLFLGYTTGAPGEMKNYMQYLVQYGYMDESGMLDENYKMVRDATMMFQKFYNIPPTGKINKKTAEMMSMARCGNPDITPARRSKRYAFYCLYGRAQKRDTSKEMTYTIKKFPKSFQLEELDTRMQIRRAFTFWTRFTNITFKEIKANGDIEVSFERGIHGNRYEGAFDGPGKVLAHAFFPPYKPRIHFDIDENWSIDNNKRGNIDLLQVAVHEIGHHLGLQHSNVRRSIMYPAYMGYDPNFDLNQDDINGIQRLYSNNRINYC